MCDVRKRKGEEEGECYSRSGMTMSMTSLLDSVDETVSVPLGVAVAGVDDLENS